MYLAKEIENVKRKENSYFTADGKASEATIRKEQRNPPNNSSNLNGIHFKYTIMEIFVEGKVKKCFFGNFNYMK